MSVQQIAINDNALRSAAARLEAAGYQGDAFRFVESMVVSVLADGYSRVEAPPALAGPTSTEEGRRRAREIFEETRRAKEAAK